MHAAHPRVCGENDRCVNHSTAHVGSSPRMRGKRAEAKREAEEAGLIPAYAGKTGGNQSMSLLQPAHPRVCGENSFSPVSMASSEGSSPRMRGKPPARSLV